MAVAHAAAIVVAVIIVLVEVGLRAARGEDAPTLLEPVVFLPLLVGALAVTLLVRSADNRSGDAVAAFAVAFPVAVLGSAALTALRRTVRSRT